MQLPEHGEGKYCSGSNCLVNYYLFSRPTQLASTVEVILQLPNHQSGEHWFPARQTARTYVAVVGSTELDIKAAWTVIY